jgi:excisionase family DNA binding protein
MSERLFHNSSERLLPTNAVARKLKKSERTVRWYAKTGRIPAVRDGEKLWKFRRDDVEALERELCRRAMEAV